MISGDYKQVRDYIKTRIAVSAPELKEWQNSLVDVQNIPKHELDNAYQIEITSVASTPKVDQHVVDDCISIVTIYRRAFNRQLDVRDELLQLANCIRLDLITPENLENYKRDNDGNIEDVVSTTITPSEIDSSNDNIIKVEIGLNVRLYFGTT